MIGFRDNVNWRYAIGEVLLIVIGISIALAANSWYENRKERAEERNMLRQIRAALVIDLDEFSSNQTAHLAQETAIIDLIEHMEGDEAFRPDMIPVFRTVRRWRGTSANSAPYEALKSRGFDLITNSELRNDIIYYYEELAARVADSSQTDRLFVMDHLAPYMDANFIYRDTASLIPIDYDALRNDIRFRNLLINKLTRLQNFILPAYQSATTAIRRLVEAIDSGTLDAEP